MSSWIWDDDIGYGYDWTVHKIEPRRVSAYEALGLMAMVTQDGASAIYAGVNTILSQNQFDALIILRYNIGSLGVIDGFIQMLERGNYSRWEFESMINGYYESLWDYEINGEGWRNRTKETLDIFFNNDYGYMALDAINGRLF